MTKKQISPQVSVAHPGQDGRLHAPAAERNAGAILDLLRRYAPATGKALEIASGTGQHVTHFATHLPGLIWQPTEIETDRLTSIQAWSTDAPAGRILPPITLDATRPGWGVGQQGHALVMLTNLLHLISGPAAQTLITEVADALAPNGRFIAYGPFLRDGKTTSDGDARFDAAIRTQNPELGYKNDIDMLGWCTRAGMAHVATLDMPANNLAFVMTRMTEQT